MIILNQFDNARFLCDINFAIFDQELINYIDFTYDILKNDYPNLIKTDKAWTQKLEKDIFASFKLKYFNCIDKYKYNDFILLCSLKYDIVRLNNILQNDNYYIHKYFFNNRYMSINIDTFLLLLTTTKGLQNFPILSSYYFNDHYFFIDYINVRIILPLYSVLIPFYLTRYKNCNNYKQKHFILKIFKWFINSYNNKLNSNFIDQEYIEKMTSFVNLISDYFQNTFIKNPSFFNLKTLLYLNFKKINKSCTDIIINYIQKKHYSYKLLIQIQDCCELTEQQNELIQSYILLNNL